MNKRIIYSELNHSKAWMRAGKFVPTPEQIAHKMSAEIVLREREVSFRNSQSTSIKERVFRDIIKKASNVEKKNAWEIAKESIIRGLRMAVENNIRRKVLVKITHGGEIVPHQPRHKEKFVGELPILKTDGYFIANSGAISHCRVLGAITVMAKTESGMSRHFSMNKNDVGYCRVMVNNNAQVHFGNNALVIRGQTLLITGQQTEVLVSAFPSIMIEDIDKDLH